MNAYFMAIIIIYMLGLGSVMATHGKPREGKHNFWSSLVITLSMIALIYFAIGTGF